jgi:hypothetical protein
MVQKTHGFGGMRCLDGAGDGAIVAAELTPGLIAVQQSFRDAGVANDFVPQVARNTLGAVAPEYDLVLHVDDAQTGRQAFENAAANVGIVKCGHAWSWEIH